MAKNDDLIGAKDMLRHLVKCLPHMFMRARAGVVESSAIQFAEGDVVVLASFPDHVWAKVEALLDASMNSGATVTVDMAEELRDLRRN